MSDRVSEVADVGVDRSNYERIFGNRISARCMNSSMPYLTLLTVISSLPFLFLMTVSTRSRHRSGSIAIFLQRGHQNAIFPYAQM